MLNDQLLEAFIYGLYGYGNFNAPIWFVGMEEGGGTSEAEIDLRLRVWDERGRYELEDLAAYHAAIHVTRYFEPMPPLQSTWAKLIRCFLTATKQPTTTSGIREYQRMSWGQWDSSTCLLELMPLPSPSTSHWTYADSSNLPYLRSRSDYVSHIQDSRATHLRQRITANEPKCVVFYGFQYTDQWQSIAGANFEANYDETWLAAVKDRTHFLILKHPATTGITNAYFEQAGTWIAQQIS